MKQAELEFESRHGRKKSHRGLSVRVTARQQQSNVEAAWCREYLLLLLVLRIMSNVAPGVRKIELDVDTCEDHFEDLASISVGHPRREHLDCGVTSAVVTAR
jgi:hypothetical protein